MSSCALGIDKSRLRQLYPEVRLSAGREQKVRVFLPVLLVSFNAYSRVAHALTSEALLFNKRQYYELRDYQLKNIEEIFDYCVELFTGKANYYRDNGQLGG